MLNSLTERISRIADDYTQFTGRGNSWKSKLSISEYAELRRQAIWEEQEGIIYDEISEIVPAIAQEPLPVEYKKSVLIEESPPNIPIKPVIETQETEKNVADIDEETRILLSIEED